MTDDRVYHAVRDILVRIGRPPRAYLGDWYGEQAERILLAIELAQQKDDYEVPNN